MEPLIKIDKEAMEALSSVLVTFMEKMEKVAGWAVTPKGKRADQEQAISFYIRELEEKEDMPALMKAALITQARKTLKEYCNTNDIVNIAINYMNESSKPEKLDEDWLSYFYEHAKNINQSDIKTLWGKILAGECNSKGSVPKQLIHILSIISKSDAINFQNVCSFMVDRINGDGSLGGRYVIIGSGNFDEDFILEKVGLSYEGLNDLQALGLIKVNAIDNRLILEEPEIEKYTIGYKYHKHIIKIQKLRKEFPIGYVSLTKPGMVLSELVSKNELDVFLEYLKKYYESQGFEVSID